MRSLFIIIAAIFFVAVLIYSWFNRDSDRVTLSLGTAMSIAVVGFIANEIIQNKTEKFSKEFPLAVFYGLPNYRPVNINLPYRHGLEMCAQNIKPNDLPVSSNEGIELKFAQSIYFDAIQYLVLESIFSKFTLGWNTQTKRIRTPDGESLRWKSIKDLGKEVSFTEFIKNNIPKNYFVKLNLIDNLQRPLEDKVILPPDTEIKINIDESGDDVLMLFSNKYISMNITISKLSSSIGIGEYSRMFSQKAPLTGHSVYLIKISGEQNYWLNGHPEMQKYRNWADSITEQLDSVFNFEVIRESHLKQFQLYGANSIQR